MILDDLDDIAILKNPMNYAARRVGVASSTVMNINKSDGGGISVGGGGGAAHNGAPSDDDDQSVVTANMMMQQRLQMSNTGGVSFT
jgi:hypothetical protein